MHSTGYAYGHAPIVLSIVITRSDLPFFSGQTRFDLPVTSGSADWDSYFPWFSQGNNTNQ